MNRAELTVSGKKKKRRHYWSRKLFSQQFKWSDFAGDGLFCWYSRPVLHSASLITNCVLSLLKLSLFPNPHLEWGELTRYVLILEFPQQTTKHLGTTSLVGCRTAVEALLGFRHPHSEAMPMVLWPQNWCCLVLHKAELSLGLWWKDQWMIMIFVPEKSLLSLLANFDQI